MLDRGTSRRAGRERAAAAALETVRVELVCSDGLTQTKGLDPAAVAARVRANPAGRHLVWAPGMSGLANAVDVEAVRRELG